MCTYVQYIFFIIQPLHSLAYQAKPLGTDEVAWQGHSQWAPSEQP